MKKVFLILSIVCAFFLAAGCNLTTSQKNPETNQPAAQESEKEEQKEEPKKDEQKNEEPAKTRAENLDFIFNVNTLGKTTITIKRSEWQTLCDDYRFFYKNENYVHAQSYEYEKDGQSWKMNDVGFRLRGNTSRVVPQGKDNGREQGQMNKDWAGDYYDYAESDEAENDYRQTHFKVDFEEFLEDDEEQRMAGCLKSVALKRADASYAREVFCYNLFRQNGIWTAPRASLTRLIFNIIEDGEGKNNAVTEVDYGVYEMFEEVNKQSLKARESGENNKATNAWKSNKGNLWKCSDDLTDSTGKEMGVEDIRIIHNGEELPANWEPKKDTYGGNRIGYVWDKYMLDLKTNKTKLSSAKTEFQAFIQELNALPDAASASDTSAIATIRAFYNKWFDMDFFLKTYAINIICGMDDDYWGNANNFYLYFDTASGGSGKVYFIPFDYDNTLGCSIQDGGVLHNPMDWGRKKDRPLIDKLLMVPEFKTKFSGYILECLNNEYWDYENCSKLFNDWGTLVSPYIDTDLDAHYGNNKQLNYDSWNPNVSLVDKSNNIYDITRDSFTSWIKGTHLAISQVEGFNGGIKIKITNIPENAAMRHIYMAAEDDPDGEKMVAIMDRDWSDEARANNNISAHIKDTEWQYPYVQDGKLYRIFVSYLNDEYQTIADTERIIVTAHGGQGELSVNNDYDYKIQNNTLKFNPKPVVKLNGSSANAGKYYIEFKKAEDWDWINGTDIGTEITDVSLNDPTYFPRNKGVTKDTQLMFNLFYYIQNPNNPGDTYRFNLVNEDQSRAKKLKLDEDFPSQIEKLADEESKPGLKLKINQDLPDGLYSYEVYLNGKRVSEMERKYTNNGEEPSDFIADKEWFYPYVQAGKEYNVEFAYKYKNWNEYRIGPEKITATSGLGEIHLANDVTYSLTNNHLIFSGPIVIKAGNNTIQNPNCYVNIDRHGSTYDGWISGSGINPSDLAALDIDLNKFISDEHRPISTADTLSFELVYNNEEVREEKGYNYRYYLFNHDETKQNNLHLTNTLNPRYTVDLGSEAEPGITITINDSVIPENAYSREIYLDGMNISEMERQYTHEGEKPAAHIADTSWYYPYVQPNKDYSFDIVYRTGDWHEALRIGPVKVKATTGLGELSVSNYDDLSYKIEDNHLIFTTGPVMKAGDKTISNPNFKFNIENRSSSENDKWIAGPENPGSNIIIYLPDHVGDDRRPVKTTDTLSFELYYKDYDETRGYDYRYWIYSHNDTKNANLHVTSDIVVENNQQGGND